MNSSFARDLSAVFSTADFGECAIVENVGNITGIFDNGEFLTDDDDYGHQSVRRRATFTTRASYGIEEGATITVRGVQYVVKYPVDDGAGVVELQLERAE